MTWPPAPITRADRAELAILKGAHVSGVIYHYLPPAAGPGYAGGEDGVDTGVTAVVLDLGDRGTIAITWAMAGELEGLAILSGASYSGIADEVLDAGKRQAWREHIGHSITSVAASWQISGEDCPESLWAIRISFGTRSIVIALGTTRQGDIDYMPDELVVVYDTSLARSYRPCHVKESSWGSPIERT